MKTSITLLTAFLFFLIATAMGQEKPIEMNGLVVHKNNKLKNVELNLYKDNELIKKVETNWLGQVDLELEKNQHYTLEANLPNFFLKRMSINTKMNRSASPETFKFEMNMIRKRDFILKHLSIKEKELFGYPFAVVTYNPDLKTMEMNRSYTLNILVKTSTLLYKASVKEEMKKEAAYYQKRKRELAAAK